ncbi:hypothetical protein LSTR_LSTR016050 [Laodelphax striatellus]|uniref:Uncharacterized protein n=1 Tax=Laodelphax striatellus TaxID=195883 RepID=A0A482WJ07_LAOST|nr:hypothetical protein LSTR_LSTR016050 [Laodelphax striatellus]
MKRLTVMENKVFQFEFLFFFVDGPVTGFGADDNFDAFLALQEPPPVPQSTPARVSRGDSKDSDDNDNDFNIFIKPKSAQGGDQPGAITPVLAPPPRSPVQNAFQDSSPRFNPFDAGQDASAAAPDSFFAQGMLSVICNKTIQ